MSHLFSRLHRSMKQDWTWSDHLIDWLDSGWQVFLKVIKYYKIRAFVENLRWMIPAAWNFRSWDYSFNIELFCRSLEETGKTMIKYGWGVDSTKVGRRAIYAAHLLREAYTKTAVDDKSFMKLRNDNNCSFKENTLVLQYKQSPEFFEKLSKVIDDRINKEVKDRKEFAWKYLHKYIESFWD